MREITRELVNELLSYDADTGIMTWKVRGQHHFDNDALMRGWNTQFSGKIAGSLSSDGYIYTTLLDRLFLSHRLIWLMQTGSWPDGHIDHIDHCRANNRWSNLRVVTNSENHRNLSQQSNNTSGVTGVSWHKQSGRWQAKIKVDGNVKYLGLFEDFSIAVATRKAAEIEFGFHPNHGMRAALQAQERNDG